MAIQYRNVDAQEVQNQVLTQRALEGERQAFAAEMEVARLQSLAGVAKRAEDKDALIAAQRDAEAQAAALRARATRVRGSLELPTEAVAEVRTEFLNTWVTSLEQEHVAHAALVEQRQASLGMTGAGAPTAEEKERIQANLDQNLEALSVIESSWRVATASLDSVRPPAENTAPPRKAAAPAQTGRDMTPSPNNAAPVE